MIHLPTPTVWPATFAMGVTLGAAGLITSPLLAVFGGVLCLVALAGWLSLLTTEEAHAAGEEPRR